MDKGAALHFPALDGLRAIAMLAVLMFHLAILFEQSLPDIFLINVFRLGFYGVDLFFLISGYILTWRYHAQFSAHIDLPQYSAFLKRRLLRIYPVHLFILIVLATMIIGAPFIGATIQQSSDYTFGAFIKHLLLISAWDFPAQLTWNHYAWAISALWLCYILTPLFIRAIHLCVSHRALIDLTLICLMTTPTLAYFFSYESTAAYAIPRALFGFFLGGLLAVGHKEKFSLARYSIMIACLCILIGMITPLRFMGLSVMAVLVIYTIKNTRAPILAHRFLQFWGQRSYSLYMVQFPILMVFKKLVLDRMAQPLTPLMLIVSIGFLIACVMIAGMATYAYIERRFSSR